MAKSQKILEKENLTEILNLNFHKISLFVIIGKVNKRAQGIITIEERYQKKNRYKVSILQSLKH